MKKIIEIIKKKWLKDTFLTILLVVIIFAIYFGINFAVEKLNLDDIDLTTDKMYSISEQTKTKLENLDSEVQIQLINLSDYDYLLDFVNKYTKVNSKISVEIIDDLASRPDMMQEYELESKDNLIVVKSGDRKTSMRLYDLTTYDYTTGEQIDKTEEVITNAIIGVTIEQKSKVYFLTGHNGYSDSYFQLVKQDIKDEANEVENLNILTEGNVPDDCSCLVITALKTDLSEMEKDKIIEYANKGGKILLLTENNILETETPNFNAILELYGFTISEGILLEQDYDKTVYGYPELIISNVQGAINKNTKTNMEICLMYAGKINFKGEEELNSLGVTYDTIAQTSDSAFLRKNYKINSETKTDEDEDAPESIMGALITRKLEDDKTAEMIVFSNCIFATNQPIANIGYADKLLNNEDAIINSISHLTKRTDTITIRKDSDSVTYTVTANQHRIIVGIIFGMPILVIIIGIVVWQVRRRKK